MAGQPGEDTLHIIVPPTTHSELMLMLRDIAVAEAQPVLKCFDIISPNLFRAF